MTRSEQALDLSKRAYDLLANGDIEEHIQALQMLDEARQLDAEAVMRYEHEVDQYKMLSITATKPTTIIYLTDEQGNLVQQETGVMQASVSPGTYFIHFGMKGEKQRIDLTRDMEFKQ